MKVRIRTEEGVEVPEYQTPGSICFDICAKKKTIIPSKSVGLIATGLYIEVPEGFGLLLCSRSSGPKKKGLLTPHGMGIIDQDYCGPEDELFVQVYNFTNNEVIVDGGERCAQGLLVPVGIAEFEEVQELSTSSRGGFGSTGL